MRSCLRPRGHAELVRQAGGRLDLRHLRARRFDALTTRSVVGVQLLVPALLATEVLARGRVAVGDPDALVLEAFRIGGMVLGSAARGASHLIPSRLVGVLPSGQTRAAGCSAETR